MKYRLDFTIRTLRKKKAFCRKERIKDDEEEEV